MIRRSTTNTTKFRGFFRGRGCGRAREKSGVLSCLSYWVEKGRKIKGFKPYPQVDLYLRFVVFVVFNFEWYGFRSKRIWSFGGRWLGRLAT